MIAELPKLISMAVIMTAFGYIVGNARSFNFYKFAIAGFVLLLYFDNTKATELYIGTAATSFLFGYLLPHAHLLEGIRDALSEAINSVRYRDAYEDIRRREEEIEELRREFEQRQAKENARRAREERAKRQKQQQQHREQREQRKQQSSSQKPEESPRTSTRRQYLITLGLDPDGDYSFKDIKKAFRRQASRWHPDKFAGQSEAKIKEAETRFKEAYAALEWLTTHS